MSLKPLQKLLRLDRNRSVAQNFTEKEVLLALEKAEKCLDIEVSLDYFGLDNTGRLNLWSQGCDKWLGYEEFDLNGIKNLTAYFVKKLTCY